MRVATKNKQKMYYSQYVGATENFERDKDGNILYTEVDGEMIPISKGTIEAHYDTPVEFTASISSKLNEMHMKSWGVDQSAIFSELACQKGYLPLKVGSIIWRTSEIKWENEQEKIPLPSSSDYTVCGLMDEGLDADFFLLQRNSEETDNNVFEKIQNQR